MGFADTFNPEDRVEVKFSEFYDLVKYKVMATMLLNGIKNEVEYDSIHKVVTGKPLHEPDTSNCNNKKKEELNKCQLTTKII